MPPKLRSTPFQGYIPPSQQQRDRYSRPTQLYFRPTHALSDTMSGQTIVQMRSSDASSHNLTKAGSPGKISMANKKRTLFPSSTSPKHHALEICRPAPLR